jgi:hypothetical protein
MQNMIFFPPKSGAKKAEWISAVGAFFHAHASINIFFDRLSGSAVALSSAASETRSPLTRASPKKSTPTNAVKKSPSARKSPIKGIVASARKKSPIKLIKRSTPDAKASRIVGQSTTHSNPAGNISTNAGMETDEAMAGSVQESMWSSGYENATGIPKAGLIRPAIENVRPKFQPAKVKLEHLSHISTSQSTQSYENASAAASSAGADENSLVPSDHRESNMLAILRGMGFTCTREILTALRAVAANREEVCVVYSTNGVDSGWSVEEHVDAAMMWIVTQREEAAEASKLDEARISSEQANLAIEQSRNQEMARVLQNADLVDLIGLSQDDIEIKSKHFPCSTLLRNRSVKKCFLKITTSSDSNSSGKEEVIRLLNLEKKARKWYGTVLPFSYFEYTLRPRLEGWARANASQMCQKLRHESDQLEKAMYNLCEQVEGGVGSVPKLFLTAQKAASCTGKPIGAEETRIKYYEDVELLEQPLPSISGRSRTTSSQPVEVIDIT